jgi:subtilisin family serine protease
MPRALSFKGREQAATKPMERYYTILLDRGGRFPTRHHGAKPEFEQPLDVASRLVADPPRPAIHRERLAPQELQELTQEPEFVAAAEIMQTRLLSPISDKSELEKGLVAGPGRSRQAWGIGAVGAEKSKFTGGDVTVAVLDTGIDASHPAFREVDLLEKDFTGYGVGDSDGHGTHCAGILFGRAVDGVRIGVAPGVRRAMIGKVVGPEGGNSDMLARGLCWAHEEGARVISMSTGLDFAATVEERVIDGWPRELATAVTLEAYRANLRLFDRLLQMLRMQEPCTGGAIIVAAAGNDSYRRGDGEFVMTACPPAGSDKIVAVGSLDPDRGGGGYRISDFSNSDVDIAAPGRCVVSARLGGGLTALSGTSVAAPHVAGVAALWWQAVRQSDLPANATLVRGKLLAGAQGNSFSASVYPAERGAGMATAPGDGSSVAWRSAGTRGFPDDRASLNELAISAESARRLAAARRMEPISVGGDIEGEGWPRH